MAGDDKPIMLVFGAIVVVGVSAAVPAALFMQASHDPRPAIVAPAPELTASVTHSDEAPPATAEPTASVTPAIASSAPSDDAGPPKAIADAGAKTDGSAKAPAEGDAPGFLSVTSVPPARVSERGRVMCTTTPCAKLPLSPGSHTITVENKDEGMKSSFVVTIQSGETTARRVTLKPAAAP